MPGNTSEVPRPSVRDAFESDLDSVPAQLCHARAVRHGPLGMPIPPWTAVVALEVLAHFEHGQQAAHRYVVKRALSAAHRNTVSRNLHVPTFDVHAVLGH